jgi:hypothetical protein
MLDALDPAEGQQRRASSAGHVASSGPGHMVAVIGEQRQGHTVPARGTPARSGSKPSISTTAPSSKRWL